MLVLAVAGVRGSIGLLIVGAAGMAVGLAAAWWFLTHRGALRWLAGVVVVLAPLTVAVLYAVNRLVWVVVVFALLFKLDISAMEPMTKPFWVASGFSLDQIAALTSGRLLATLAGPPWAD